MPKEASDKGVEPMAAVKAVSKEKEEPVVKKEKKKIKRSRFRGRKFRRTGCPTF